MTFIKTNLIISKFNRLFKALGNLFSILSSFYRTFISSIYIRVFMYMIELTIILSVIYITLNTYYSEVNFEIYFLASKIELIHLWVLAGIIIIRRIAIFIIKTFNITSFNIPTPKDFSKESAMEDLMFIIGDRIMKTFMNTVNIICSFLLANISYGLSLLKSNYVDRIDLSAGIQIIRSWSKQDLSQHLTNKLLTNPGIVAQLQHAQLTLPLSEKLTTEIISKSNNLAEVESGLLASIEMVRLQIELQAKKMEEKRYLEFIDEIKNLLDETTKALDASNFWATAGYAIGMCIGSVFVAISLLALMVGVITVMDKHAETKDREAARDTYKIMSDFLLKDNPLPQTSEVGARLRLFKSFSKTNIINNIEKSNTDISNLEAEVDNIKIEISKMLENNDADISVIKSKLDMCFTNLSNVRDAINTLTSEMEETTSRIDEISSKLEIKEIVSEIIMEIISKNS